MFNGEKEACYHEILVGTQKKLVINICQFWHAAQKRLPTPGLGIIANSPGI